MMLRCFTVFDVKVGAYLSPFFMRSKPEAIRAFSDLVNDPKTQFSQHPEDYVLYCIAEFDDATGNVVPIERADMLCKAVELVVHTPPMPLFEDNNVITPEGFKQEVK